MINTKNKENNWLSAHRKKITSQFGEDGVIEEIFKLIGEENKWCVEFGAGRGNTNTWSLINQKGWSGVLIEINPVYCRDMRNAYKDNDQVVIINKAVNFERPNLLDNILCNTVIPTSFDFMVVDIDGNDYHVWESFQLYKPRVVMVEYNGRIPLDMEFVQPQDFHLQWGSSLASIVKLGQKKGYELVYAYANNAIFVKKELFKLFCIMDNSIAAIARDYYPQGHFFQLYDGTIVLHGMERILADKKKISKKPLYVLTLNGLFPVTFSYDRKITRFIKNFIKGNNFIYSFIYPHVEKIYGDIWTRKRKKLFTKKQRQFKR